MATATETLFNIEHRCADDPETDGSRVYTLDQLPESWRIMCSRPDFTRLMLHCELETWDITLLD